MHAFDVLGDPVRRRILELLVAGELTSGADGARRHYALDDAPLRGVDAWLAPFRQSWAQRLDALRTELSRGKRGRA